MIVVWGGDEDFSAWPEHPVDRFPHVHGVEGDVFDDFCEEDEFVVAFRQLVEDFGLA